MGENIEINNLTTLEVSAKFVRGIAKKVLEGENRGKAGISIAFVGQGKIRELNRKYRSKNKVTDVLAFGDDNKYNAQMTGDRQQELGEVVICLREVRKNAKKYNSTFEKELAKILIHGILHLLGHDHEKSEAEAAAMREKEKYYFLH